MPNIEYNTTYSYGYFDFNSSDGFTDYSYNQSAYSDRINKILVKYNISIEVVKKGYLYTHILSRKDKNIKLILKDSSPKNTSWLLYDYLSIFYRMEGCNLNFDKYRIGLYSGLHDMKEAFDLNLQVRKKTRHFFGKNIYIELMRVINHNYAKTQEELQAENKRLEEEYRKLIKSMEQTSSYSTHGRVASISNEATNRGRLVADSYLNWLRSNERQNRNR